MEANLVNQTQKSKEAQGQKAYLAQRNKEMEQSMLDWKHSMIQNNTKIEYLEKELAEYKELHQKLLVDYSDKVNYENLATDTYSLTEQVKYLNLRNKEEAKIYRDKIDKMKFQFDRLNM